MSWREYLSVGVLSFGSKGLEARTYEVVATPGAEAANVIDVSLQLNTQEGKAIETSGLVNWYLSDDANGIGVAAAAPSGGVAAGAAGVVTESLADLIGTILTDGTGLANFSITETAAKTFYLVIESPCGVRSITPVVFT